jgi:hypothetical protein
MKLPHPFVAGTVLTVSHFLASLSIIPLTLRVGEALADGAADSILYGLLTVVTKWLYFPILAMALYPCHWFPGNLIAIPIAVNSLLWGGVFMLGLVVGRYWQTRRRR